MLITALNVRQQYDLRNANVLARIPKLIGTSTAVEELRMAAAAAIDGNPVDRSLATVRYHEWEDAKMLYTAGVLQNSGLLKFFDGTPIKFASNWPSPNGLQKNELFVATCFRLDLRFGLLPTSAGAAGDFDVATAVAGSTTDANVRANFYDYFIKRGLVNLAFSNRQIIKDMIGMERFPWGSGPVGWGNSAATSASQSNATNGVAQRENCFAFTPFEFLNEQEQVSCTVEHQAAAALTVTGVDAHIVAMLGGYSITLPG